MGKIIAIANQKGGVGKTTTAVNLSACLAEAGKRVLLIDLDPQGNATQGVGIDKNTLPATLYSVVIGHHDLREAIVPTGHPHFDAVPSNRELAGAEIELIDEERREYCLRGAIESVQADYDYLIIDCPPSLSLLTVNGLVAANEVLITLQCEYYALEGLSELLQTVIRVRDNLNPPLTVLGVVLTMFQNTNLSRQVLEDVRGHLGAKVFNTVIPRNVTLSEAPSFGKPVIHYDGKSTGALAYHALAGEVIARG